MNSGGALLEADRGRLARVYGVTLPGPRELVRRARSLGRSLSVTVASPLDDDPIAPSDMRQAVGDAVSGAFGGLRSSYEVSGPAVMKAIHFDRREFDPAIRASVVQVKSLQAEHVDAVAETEKSQDDLDDLKAVLSAGGGPHILRRLMHLPLYLAILIAAGVISAYFNATSFLIFGASDIATVAVALLYAMMYAAAAHAIGAGANAPKERRLRRWALPLLGATFLLGTVAVSVIRGTYAALFHHAALVWAVVSVQLLVDVVAVVASIMYSNPDADAVREAEREIAANQTAEADSKERLGQKQKEWWALRHSRLAAVQGRIDDFEQFRRYADEDKARLCEALEQCVGFRATLLLTRDLVFEVREPRGLARAEEWCRSEEAELASEPDSDPFVPPARRELGPYTGDGQ